MLAAIAAVDRAAFVGPADAALAWENRALPIADGQTISQPLVVARMCELLALRGDETVLDVGTGSGYHAAVLARLGRRVLSIEVLPGLAAQARAALAAVGAVNVTCAVGDGVHGWPEQAPFAAINVAAAGPASRLQALVAQLAPGGRLVAPVVARSGEQRLVVVSRDERGRLHRDRHERVRFVPLVAIEPCERAECD